MPEDLDISDVQPNQIPAKRTRASSEFYTGLLKRVDGSKTGAIKLDASDSERQAKSVYWGLSVFLKKNNLREKYKVVLREKEKAVFISKTK